MFYDTRQTHANRNKQNWHNNNRPMRWEWSSISWHTSPFVYVYKTPLPIWCPSATDLLFLPLYNRNVKYQMSGYWKPYTNIRQTKHPYSLLNYIFTVKINCQRFLYSRKKNLENKLKNITWISCDSSKVFQDRTYGFRWATSFLACSARERERDISLSRPSSYPSVGNYSVTDRLTIVLHACPVQAKTRRPVCDGPLLLLLHCAICGNDLNPSFV